MKKVFLLLSLISTVASAELYPSYGMGIGVNMGYPPMYPQQGYGGYGDMGATGYGGGYPVQQPMQQQMPQQALPQDTATNANKAGQKMIADSATVDKAAALLKQDMGIDPNASPKVKLTPEQMKAQKEKLTLKRIDKNNDKSLDSIFSETYPSNLYYPEEITLKDH